MNAKFSLTLFSALNFNNFNTIFFETKRQKQPEKTL